MALARAQSDDLRRGGIALAALALAVVAGIAGFLTGGAPKSYALVNAAALLLACLPLLLLQSGRLRQGEVLATIVVALGLLAATLLIGPETEGVHRWLAAGPVTLHVGMLVIPSLCVLMARLGPGAAMATLVAALAIVWAQPDSASALALFCAVILSCEAQERKGNGLLRWVALAGLLLTAVRADPLEGVRFVETAIGDAWKALPLLGALQMIALICALIIPPAVMAGGIKYRTAPALGLAGAMTGFAVAGLIAAYPQPLIGYGASAMLGYGLALGLLRGLAER